MGQGHTGQQVGAGLVSPRSRWTVAAVAFVAFLVPMLLWTLASPLMSLPDEPAHAIRAAAVVRGDVAGGSWDADPTTTQATVPKYVAHTHELTCFAFRADVTAGCQQGVKGDPDRLVTTGTSAGPNSPLYYAIVGTPTLFLSGNSALYAMRGVNAVLCAAALAVMVMQLMQLARWRWSLVAAFVATTPMMLYLGGAINPNGLEAASAGALTATLIGLMRNESTRGVLAERLIFTTVFAGLLLSTRSIAMLWTLIAIGVALMFSRSTVLRSLLRRPSTWIAAVLCVAVSAATLYWYLNPPVLDGTKVFAGTDTGIKTAFVMMVLQTFDYASAWIGLFGWVDTPAPGYAIAVWGGALAALFVAGVLVARGRGRITVIGMLVLIVLVPALSQASVIQTIGYIWQGRYTLALLVMLLVVCGVALDDTHRDAVSTPIRRIVGTGIVLLTIGHVFTFFWTLRRYVVGVPTPVDKMWEAPSWQPPLGWLPLTLAYALAVALGALLVWRSLRRAEFEQAGTPDEPTLEPPTSLDEPTLEPTTSLDAPADHAAADHDESTTSGANRVN